MRGKASKGFNVNKARQWSRRVCWLGLEVVESIQQGDIGYVEFIARYRLHHQDHQLHERSEFHRINQKWYYVDEVM